MRLRHWILGFVAICFVTAPALAQDIQGSWQGALQGQLRLVVHIQKAADGSYTGSMDSPDQGATGIPLASIVADGQSLAFEVPLIRGRYRGTWDAAGNQWKGEWTQGITLPLNFTRASGERTSVSTPAVAGLDGDWEGAIELGAQQRLRCVFHVRTTNAGTTATMDSLDQNATGIPVSGISRSGNAVKLEVQLIGGVFEGQLGADGSTLTGQWMQGGLTFPFNLTRRPPG